MRSAALALGIGVLSSRGHQHSIGCEDDDPGGERDTWRAVEADPRIITPELSEMPGQSLGRLLGQVQQQIGRVPPATRDR